MNGPPRVSAAPHRRLSAARSAADRRRRLKRWYDDRDADVALRVVRARYGAVSAHQLIAPQPDPVPRTELGLATPEPPRSGALLREARVVVAAALMIAALAGTIATGHFTNLAPIKSFKIARLPQTVAAPIPALNSVPGTVVRSGPAHLRPGDTLAAAPPLAQVTAREEGGAGPDQARSAGTPAATMAAAHVLPDPTAVPSLSEPPRVSLAPADVPLSTTVPAPQSASPDDGGQCWLESRDTLAMLTPPAEGEAFGRALAAAAKRQTGEFVVYTDKYRQLAFPMGDVPAMFGVCTDVVIRAYRALGIDLQALIHSARIGSRDASIAHRRTFTLRRYFASRGASLPVTDFAEDYLPGDIVTYDRPQNRGSRDHIAIVSEIVAPSGRPMIVHNRGWGPQLEDALFVDRITGHYRYQGRTAALVSGPAATDGDGRAGSKGRYAVLKGVPSVKKRTDAVKAALRARGLQRAGGKVQAQNKTLNKGQSKTR